MTCYSSSGMGKELPKACVILWQLFLIALVLGYPLSPPTSDVALSSVMKHTAPPFSSRMPSSLIASVPVLSRITEQYQPLNIKKGTGKSGNFPRENRQQRSVSQRNECLQDAVQANNNSKNNFNTNNTHGIVFLYPEEDFEYLKVLLTMNTGEQYLTFTKAALCINETNRWYKLEFSAQEFRLLILNTWIINVTVDSCSMSKGTNVRLFGRFQSLEVSVMGRYYWRTNECLFTPSDVSAQTTAGVVTFITLAIVIGAVIVVVVVYRRKRGGDRQITSNSSASYSESKYRNGPIYDDVVVTNLQEERNTLPYEQIYDDLSLGKLQEGRNSYSYYESVSFEK
ncbi:uncharacterized protein [Cherax quadricarinatus]|uniref:uncharacterized protein n=1 Tax=Cherax quadricarinatus TaxID=27406 RepID=UPI00237841BE|nr:uncharacterized protein LOC128693298 [Cherax quadricarinatus]